MMAEALLTAVDAAFRRQLAAKDGKRGKFLRRVTRKALRLQEGITLANRRFSAVLAGQYELKDVGGARRLDGRQAMVCARFRARSRKWEEDTVPLYSRQELAAVVRHVSSTGEVGMEYLKPHKMAEVSPRVFWSMVKLFGSELRAGLDSLCPDIDWTPLDSRARRLSAKGRESAEYLAAEREEGKEEEEKKEDA
eukprot:PLAT14665.2.p2 GENE.PLAT14665.2~~PLAT14665.2.p2  ORF type:complete len:194 (+),score=71.32 PLAT14665.2:552-1133(+)